MSENVENKFNLAANYIQSHHHEFNKSDLLQFYAFYKQSTVNKIDKNTQSRPSFFKVQERAKYDAWASLASMEETEAKKLYIELLTKLAPKWVGEAEDSSGSFGVSVSRPKIELIEESDKTIEDFVREGNVDQLHKVLASIGTDELNTLDDTGLGLIHWASDRGNYEVLSLVLKTKSINIDLQDSDGQTSLFYASSCGHKDCVKLLLDNGANKEILDNEGSSCLDVAYDDEIRKLLS